MGKKPEQYIVDEAGEKKSVVLPIEEYEEMLEDLHDLVIIAERKDEPVLKFDELKNKLKEHGLL